MRQISILLTLLFLSFNSISQNLKLEEIESDLIKSFKKLKESNYLTDSAEIENKKFRLKLFKYLTMYPNSLNYNFYLLEKENCHIVNSSDSLFKIYSWNTNNGGTMSFYENIFQFKSGQKVLTLKVNDSIYNNERYIPYYSQLHTLKTNNKTYYLAVKNGNSSSKDAFQSIKIFTIENYRLLDNVKLFKTKDGLTNEINVPFDFLSIVDRPERPLKLITYDDKTKRIYIPIVLENGKVTNRFIVYEFNGQNFQVIEIQKK